MNALLMGVKLLVEFRKVGLLFVRALVVFMSFYFRRTFPFENVLAHF